MREDGRESDNVEDLRGVSGGGGGGGGFGGIGIPHLSIGGIVIALVVSYFLGINPLTVLGLLSGTSAPQQQAAPVQQAQQQGQQGQGSHPSDPLAHFVSVVLANTEDTWTAVFKQMGKTYREPKLVLFTGSTPTACGTGRTAAGPFYCPQDEKVYIDLQFYQMLHDRFHAPGDFAQAYVIAHEVGHHVQNLLGIMAKADAARAKMNDEQYNAVSVRLELQADCYAGVWAHDSDQMHKFIDAGDLESALNAAAAIGDDTLQKQAQGYAVPETFTHGTSAQRQRWFRNGFDHGSLQACDTFSAQAL